MPCPSAFVLTLICRERVQKLRNFVRRQSIQCKRCHSQINTIPCCYVGETNRQLAKRARGGDCGGGGGCGGGSDCGGDVDFGDGGRGGGDCGGGSGGDCCGGVDCGGGGGCGGGVDCGGGGDCGDCECGLTGVFGFELLRNESHLPNEFAFWSRVEGRGSRVTSRGSRVNGRGSRVTSRGSKNSLQLLLNVVKLNFGFTRDSGFCFILLVVSW